MEIDLDRTIRRVGVKVKGNSIIGLRLVDNNDEVIVEETWSSTRFGTWSTQEIPVGYEVIGL